MEPEKSQAVELQREYYRKTAQQYEEMHGSNETEHEVAKKWIISLARTCNAKSVLDVGCGTGRTVRDFRKEGFEAQGVEPVAELLEVGKKDPELTDCLHVGDACKLPFPDASFDVVTEFAVLHHIPRPELAVSEMLRVARKAVFFSDENRFGRGSMLWRLTKFATWVTGTHDLLFKIKTRGKGFNYSEGDGVFFSYSVYDSYDQVAKWADSAFILPLKRPTSRSWFHPLLTCSHGLLCGFKDPGLISEN